MTEIIITIIKAAGAAGILLCSIKLLTDGLRKANDSRTGNALRLFAANKSIAVFMGIVLSILMQSSLAPSLIAVAITGAGIIAPANAIAMIAGSVAGESIAALSSFTVSLIPASSVLGVITIPLLFSKKSRRRESVSLVLAIAIMLISITLLQPAQKIALPNLQSILLSFFSGILSVLSFSRGAISSVLAAMETPILQAIAAITGSALGTMLIVFAASFASAENGRRTAFSSVTATAIISFLFILLIKPFENLILSMAEREESALTLFMIIQSFVTAIAIAVLSKPLQNVYDRLFTKKEDGESLNAKETLTSINNNETRLAAIITEMFAELSALFSEENTKEQIALLREEKSYTDNLAVNLIASRSSSLSGEELGNAVRKTESARDIASAILSLALLEEKRREQHVAISDEEKADLEELCSKTALFLDSIAAGFTAPVKEKEIKEAQAESKNINRYCLLLQQRAGERIKQSESIASTTYLLDAIKEFNAISTACKNIAESSFKQE